MSCFFFGHTWLVTKRIIDPMDVPGTFSNYVNYFYDCECVECGKTKSIKKSVIIPEGSQLLQNRRAGYKLGHQIGTLKGSID